MLTRVGAYYHDIGKTKKPDYFTENQNGKENRHDKLTPSMSALIIKSHVKDGLEMAREHRLPKAIVDLIAQHHGNSLIEYFYDKARKEAEEEEIVEEEHYRYPGPKPQTKEAGILMLADAVEASSRTLSDPSPAKIQGLVQKILNKVFASGQLDQSELTLRDLHLIAKSFTKVLTASYRRRVEYSESAAKGRDQKLPKQAQAEPSKKEGGVKDSRDREIPRLSQQIEREGKEYSNGSGGEKKDSSRTSRKSGGGKKAEGHNTEKPADSDGKEALKRLGM